MTHLQKEKHCHHHQKSEKKNAYARLLGLSTSLTILSVKLISILIILFAKLVQESSGPRFTSLTVSPEQKISSEEKVNYGLFGDNNLCSVSDLNHSQIVTDNKIRKTS